MRAVPNEGLRLGDWDARLKTRNEYTGGSGTGHLNSRAAQFVIYSAVVLKAKCEKSSGTHVARERDSAPQQLST